MIVSFEELKTFVPKKPTYALFGYPVHHSVSPELHAALLSSATVEADYIAVAVPPECLAEAADLARGKLQGFNLTIPHKQAIIPLLNDISPEAYALNSVNTVCVKDGMLTGYNTDIYGFSAALKKGNVSLKDTHVCLLGCGGVATVMAEHCLAEGAQLTIAARNAPKAQAFASYYTSRFPRSSIATTSFDAIPSNCSVVLGATPVGMSPREGQSPIETLPKDTTFVFDSIYNPPTTTLLSMADGRGIARQDGLYMLMMQAVFAQQIWQRITFSEAMLSPVLQKLYADLCIKRLREVHGKENLILCGFMGSGKSTIARRLKNLTDLTFYDCDALIEEEQGKKITQIFEESGEPAFRTLEHEMIGRLSKTSGSIIATGGGFIKNPKNIALLKEKGFFIFLNPPLSSIRKHLKGDQSRPLLAGSSKANQMQSLWKQRQPFYLDCADIVVEKQKISEILEDIFLHI